MLALAACSGPDLPIPPTPTPNLAAVAVVQNHQHGESGAAGGRLVTRYGGSVAVALVTQPQEPQPQAPLTITYSLRDGVGAPMTLDKLRITHERPMHLIVVSQDLRFFSHIHPQDVGSGSYAVADALPAPGKYLLFNEFVTADGTTQIERNLVATEGAESADAPAALAPSLGTPLETDGLTTVLLANTPKIRRRVPAILTLQVTRDGKPVDNLQPYLGAPCHVVIISADTRQFAHTHGDVPGGAMSGDMSGMSMGSMAMPTPPPRFGPAVQFTHTFMQAGLYRVWVQFGHTDKVVTAGFNVEVGK